MKVCIIGSGELGLSMAKELYELGAHVSVFHQSSPGGGAMDIHQHFQELELLKDFSRLNFSSVKELVDWADELRILRPAQVVRVHKRVLSLKEDLKDKTRMSDLFRVIYRADFSKELKEQREKNPEVFQNLDEHTLKSLEGVLENFDDFDVVINASGKWSQPNRSGPSGEEALNENRIGITYGKDCLNEILNLETTKSVMIVGSGMMSALAILKLSNWLKADPNRSLHVVTTEYPPFDSIKNEWPQLSERVHSLIDDFYKIWMQKNESFRSEVHQWRELEEHIRAKVPAPKEPMSQLMIYPGHQVLAYDLLSDRSGIFATIEDRNNLDSLKTIATDKVFCMTGHTDNHFLDKSLRVQKFWKKGERRPAIVDEPGYYFLTDLDQINEIQENILTFFSKVEE